jgi:hypothetical protein
MHTIDEKTEKHITRSDNQLKAIEKFLKNRVIDLSSLIKTRYVKKITYDNCQIDYNTCKIHFHSTLISFEKLIELMNKTEYIYEYDDLDGRCYNSTKHIFQEVNLIE